MEFNGIPWNCSCHRNWRTWSSLEFHGTARVIEIGALQVPWNSMELLVSAKLAHLKFLGIPRNFMELLVSAKLAHPSFHGIPWNCSIIEIGALEVPWNSMELLVSSTLAHSKFHGIPWNCSCQWNWRTRSSMEFYGTARVSEIGAFPVPWNSMEFHGTARVSEIGALEIPWNSMELLVSAKLAHSKFHGIPWNSMELLVSSNWCTRSSMEFHRNAGVSSMEFHGTLFCYLMEPLVSSIHWVLKWYRIPWNLSFKILMKNDFQLCLMN